MRISTEIMNDELGKRIFRKLSKRNKFIKFFYENNFPQRQRKKKAKKKKIINKLIFLTNY